MSSRLVVVIVLAGAVSSCDARQSHDVAPTTSDSSARAATLAGGGGGAPASPRFPGIGRAPSAAEILAWDIDVNPSGVGLPSGSGTYARGTVVYRQRCAACHGLNGEGIAANPRLVGRAPADFSFARVGPSVPRTIGNYWPYATTLYDYINRAMPFDAPGTLPPADVYSLVAYLLGRNGIVDSTSVMDAKTLPAVVMPARDRFVIDDRTGRSTVR